MPTTTLGVATGGLWQDYLVETDQDGIRQRIVNAVGVRMTEILTASGYRTDLGQHVFLYRPASATYGAEELPAINYRDVGADAQDDGSMGQFRWRLNFQMSVKLSDGGTSPATARKMLNDIYNAIWRDMGQWNSLATYTEQASDSFELDQQEMVVMGININFSVIYDAPLGEI